MTPGEGRLTRGEAVVEGGFVDLIGAGSGVTDTDSLNFSGGRKTL
jgi:hypothetical protein